MLIGSIGSFFGLYAREFPFDLTFWSDGDKGRHILPVTTSYWNQDVVRAQKVRM